jgi:hypothetical protein
MHWKRDGNREKCNGRRVRIFNLVFQSLNLLPSFIFITQPFISLWSSPGVKLVAVIVARLQSALAAIIAEHCLWIVLTGIQAFVEFVPAVARAQKAPTPTHAHHQTHRQQQHIQEHSLEGNRDECLWKTPGDISAVVPVLLKCSGGKLALKII